MTVVLFVFQGSHYADRAERHQPDRLPGKHNVTFPWTPSHHLVFPCRMSPSRPRSTQARWYETVLGTNTAPPLYGSMEPFRAAAVSGVPLLSVVLQRLTVHVARDIITNGAVLDSTLHC